MRALFVAACVLSASPAFATGGFSCTIDDENLKMSAESGLSHGVGEPFLNFAGTLELGKALAPNGLAAITLDSAALPHHWLYGDELRLRIYAETKAEPFGSLDLAIMTKQDAEDETRYEGDYILGVDTAAPLPGNTETHVEKRGKVACSVG